MASGIYKPFVDNTISGWGNNHSGYIGFRGINGKLKDDGAIKVIVADWKANNRQIRQNEQKKYSMKQQMLIPKIN